jgi:hypothetical protein
MKKKFGLEKRFEEEKQEARKKKHSWEEDREELEC